MHFSLDESLCPDCTLERYPSFAGCVSTRQASTGDGQRWEGMVSDGVSPLPTQLASTFGQRLAYWPESATVDTSGC